MYNKHTGYILGFVKLGDVNKHIDELGIREKCDEIAIHMLVFDMVFLLSFSFHMQNIPAAH